MKSWEREDLFPLNANHRRLAELNNRRTTHLMIEPEGRLMIGVGRRLHTEGLRDEEVDMLLYNDLMAARRHLLEHHPWSTRLDPVRFAALQELILLRGTRVVDQLVKFLLAVELDDFRDAALELADLKWSREHGYQSQRIIHMIATGEWPWEKSRKPRQSPQPFPLTLQREV